MKAKFKKPRCKNVESVENRNSSSIGSTLGANKRGPIECWGWGKKGHILNQCQADNNERPMRGRGQGQDRLDVREQGRPSQLN